MPPIKMVQHHVTRSGVKMKRNGRKPSMHALKPIMTPERIMGALIWNVWHDRLEDDLILLVDTLPKEFVADLEGELETMVNMTKGSNMDPKVRTALIELLRDEISGTLDMLGKGE
jgi:hypothetical protein